MWEKGDVSKWVGRRERNLSFESLVEDEPEGPVVAGGQDQGMDWADLSLWAGCETPNLTTSRWGRSRSEVCMI